MTDYAAQLLNELMGRNRDLLPDQQVQKLSYDSPEVCHYYLVKLCPHDLFTNTRVDIGPCGGVHDDDAKEEFLKLPPHRRIQYEDEFLRYCQSMLNEVERKIRKSRQRLELQPDDEKLASLVPPQFSRQEERIASLTGRITKLVTEAEELGCQGQVDEAQSIMRLCDKLKDERDRLRRNNESSVWHQAAEMAASQEKQMQVCDICGSFLILSDAQQRIDDHLTGKQHLGYARLRQVVDEMRESREKEKKEQEAAREKEREERRQREAAEAGSRDRDRRDRDRERERDRERDNRDRDRASRNGERDRTERNGDRRRHRSRSRDRERERDRHRHRESDRRDRDAERRNRETDRRERDADRREREPDRREREPDRREREPDRREREPDRREREPDRRERDSDRRERETDRRDREPDRRERDHDRRDRDPDRRERDSERRERDPDRRERDPDRRERDPDREREREYERRERDRTDGDRERQSRRSGRSRSRSRRRSRERRDSRDRADEPVRRSTERTGPRTPSAEPPDSEQTT